MAEIEFEILLFTDFWAQCQSVLQLKYKKIKICLDQKGKFQAETMLEYENLT